MNPRPRNPKKIPAEPSKVPSNWNDVDHFLLKIARSPSPDLVGTWPCVRDEKDIHDPYRIFLHLTFRQGARLMVVDWDRELRRYMLPNWRSPEPGAPHMLYDPEKWELDSRSPLQAISREQYVKAIEALHPPPPTGVTTTGSLFD